MIIVSWVMGGCQSVGTTTAYSPAVKQMKVNGVELAYVEEGSGPTVLFVHGAAGDWRTWDGVRPYFSSQFRYVSMSRRYHHPNAWADDGRNYTFDQDVEDIAEFIRAMNVGKVHLVGNSYSGRLVGYVALKYPELLRSVVLGEPSLAAPTSPEGKSASGAMAKDFAQSSSAAKSGDQRLSAIILANAVLDDPEGFNKWPAARQEQWLDNAKTMAPMWAGARPKPVSCSEIGQLKVPALVVRGEKTRASYRYGHDALLACLPPSAVAAVVPDATHTWMGDSPSSAAAAIIPFVSRH
jgi:pimeloyl-ACP methyl ester carboxylesterase